MWPLKAQKDRHSYMSETSKLKPEKLSERRQVKHKGLEIGRTYSQIHQKNDEQSQTQDKQYSEERRHHLFGRGIIE